MKQIQLLIACLLLAGSLLAIDHSNYKEVEKNELMKIFGNEAKVDQFLREVEVRKPVKRKAPIENRSLNTELIIITNEDMESWFIKFAELKKKEGIVTEVVTTATTGSTKEQIRSWLATQKTSNPSLQYVLLGGDDSIIPTKSFHWIKNGVTKTSTTDFYYSNILSTWPVDEDILEIDFAPDVYVGRVPARNISEAAKFYYKYQNFRSNYTENTDKMKFIVTNIDKLPSPGCESYIIDHIMDHVGSEIICEPLYSYDLVDTLNGCAKIITDVFQARDYSFLYGTWHGGECYEIYDSEYNRNDDWWERSFGKHWQTITVKDYYSENGTCWYSNVGGSAKYHYSSTSDSYLKLHDVLPVTQGASYVAWIASCETANMNFESRYQTHALDNNGDIIVNYSFAGCLFDYEVDEIPSWEYNENNCFSEEYFNELGGPIAIYASSCDDSPFFTKQVVEEYMDLQFIQDEHRLGNLTKDSWNIVSCWLEYRSVREMALGYTLFGDPSMDVWSAEAEKLVTSTKQNELKTETVFYAKDSSGNPVDALVCMTNENGAIKGRGISPYTFTEEVLDSWIITANKANYIQSYARYDEIKNYARTPYTMDFESGIDYNWEMHSSNEYGRIEVSGNLYPYEGKVHLTMDSNKDREYVINEAWLHLNLDRERDVELIFYWKEFGDENHRYDGVYFSDDGGANFIKVHSFDSENNPDNTWAEVVLDVAEIADENKLQLTNDFVIKFQQYDNEEIKNDGFAFDCISVYDPTRNLIVEDTKTASLSPILNLSIHPNPFNPETTISFELNEKDAKNVKIEIFNIKGQKVRELKIDNSKFKINTVVWNGKDEQENQVSSGIYFVILKAGKFIESKKVLLMK